MTDASFQPGGDADPTTAPVRIQITDDELKEVGWMVDTKELDKKGWEQIYLACLSVSGEQVKSADEAGISVRRVQDRIKNDAVFAELHQQAFARSDALAEDMARMLALKGVPVSYKRKDGTVVTENRIDTRFLEFWLERKIPGFRDADKSTLKALEGGIVVKFQIDGAPTPAGALPAADVEAEAEEITDTDTPEP